MPGSLPHLESPVWIDGLVGSLRREELLFQDSAVVVNNFAGDAAVVVRVHNALASARIIEFLGEKGFVVAVFVVVYIDDPAAGRLLTGEVLAGDGHHSASLAT
jgi:hypothetical protein